MMEVLSNVEPIVLTATVRIFFVDGSIIPISDVTDVEDDGILYTIQQKNGDYLTVPIENNVKLMEVSYDQLAQ